MSRFVCPFATLVFAVIATQTVEGGAVVTLVPNNPGPYFGGESLVVDVYVTSNQSVQARLLGFDFSASDAAIVLTGPDGPDPDTIPEFVFDFSTLIVSAFYSTFPNLPIPQTVTSGPGPVPGFLLNLMSGVAFHAGTVTVRLPYEPGEYVLDAMNFDAHDTNSGARIDFDFANTVTWSTFDDGNVELTGGQRTFVVVPEATTLIMLAVGIIPLVHRRAAKRGEVA